MQATGETLRRYWAGALCAVALAAFASPAHAQDRFTLRATAGLAGFVKPGRAAPVVVDIEHHGSSADAIAEVVVSWGDANVRRRVFMGSTRARRVEIVARTNEPAGIVKIGISGQNSVVEVPVTVLPHTAPVTLCVSGPDDVLADSARCSMTVEPERLPRSAAAYEIVSDALIAEGARIPEASRVALTHWLGVARLEASGDLSFTPQVTRPLLQRGLPVDTASTLRVAVWLYTALLLGVGMFVATIRFAVRTTWIAVALVVMPATFGAWLLGRGGPASQINVHHQSLLQQIPGTDAALVSMRGVIEFPNNGFVSIRLPIESGSLEGATDKGRADQLVDESGLPQLVIAAGLGSRRAWTGDAITQTRWMATEDVDGKVTITNETNFELNACRFADGMSVTDVGVLAPGAKATAVRKRHIVGPLFTCTTSQPALTLTADTAPVVMQGTTVVVVYHDREGTVADDEGPND